MSICTLLISWSGSVNAQEFREITQRLVAILSKLWKYIPSIVSLLHTLILNTKHKSKLCSGVKLVGPGMMQVIMSMRSNVMVVVNRRFAKQRLQLVQRGQIFICDKVTYSGKKETSRKLVKLHTMH